MVELSHSNLGIIVADFLELLSHDFIYSLCHGEENRSNIEVVWKRRPEWYRSSDPLILPCGIYDVSSDGQYTLHLITFPQAIRKDFPLDDLQFPFKISGIIFLIDLTGNIVKSENLTRHFERLRRQEYSGLTWAKSFNLPLVITAIHSGSPYISIDTLHELLDLNAAVPIIPYHIEPEDIGYFDYEDIHTYKFSHEHTQMVLSALIQQF